MAANKPVGWFAGAMPSWQGLGRASVLAALAALLLCALPAGRGLYGSTYISAQETPWVSSAARSTAKAQVQFLFPEQISIAARKQAAVDLHFRVAAGLHINSHTPHGKTLIPTNLIVIEQPGVKVAAVGFPPGTEYSFAFSPDEKVSIYSDEFVLHARLTAEAGDHLLQGALRYQACNANTCFPPKTIPVAIDVIAK